MQLRSARTTLFSLLSVTALACGGTEGSGTSPRADAGPSNSNSNPDSGTTGAVDAGQTPRDAGTSNPACDDVAGTWSPTGLNTCVAPGDDCVLTQVGCSVELDCDNGAFSVSGEASDGHLELENGANRCTADVSGDSMRASCTGPDIFNGACQGDFVRDDGPGPGPGPVDGDGRCGTAEQCDFRCSSGAGCQHVCTDSSSCDTTCSTGDCQITCSGGADCDSGCSGGGCTMNCQGAADCDFRCSGGNCVFNCATTGRCDTQCSGGGCVGG